MCQFVKLLANKRIICGSLMLRGVKGTNQVEENCRSLHPIIPFSNSFFLISHYSLNIYPLFSLFSMYRIDARRVDLVDVDLTYSTESTRVGKSWRTKTIEQRRLSDDRVILS